jgi:heme/copper-type cytochrome/quinol oxidase subunit 3
MRDLLNIEYQQLNYLRSYFIIIGVATALVVVGLVAMGFLSTGVARRKRFT